ncbi:hypothetical protein LY76DRAFT_433941 [Colletotrichum caudatum]|nr:hypothetical protein LY76DRAFT_433941 [Colletotrichum caudatum]
MLHCIAALSPAHPLSSNPSYSLALPYQHRKDQQPCGRPRWLPGLNRKADADRFTTQVGCCQASNAVIAWCMTVASSTQTLANNSQNSGNGSRFTISVDQELRASAIGPSHSPLDGLFSTGAAQSAELNAVEIPQKNFLFSFS